jgi:hypothetical protein
MNPPKPRIVTEFGRRAEYAYARTIVPPHLRLVLAALKPWNIRFVTPSEGEFNGTLVSSQALSQDGLLSLLSSIHYGTIKPNNEYVQCSEKEQRGYPIQIRAESIITKTICLFFQPKSTF